MFWLARCQLKVPQLAACVCVTVKIKERGSGSGLSVNPVHVCSAERKPRTLVHVVVAVCQQKDARCRHKLFVHLVTPPRRQSPLPTHSSRMDVFPLRVHRPNNRMGSRKLTYTPLEENTALKPSCVASLVETTHIIQSWVNRFATSFSSVF